METTQPSKYTLKVANPSLEDKARTYLTSDTDAGATSLSTSSNSGFSGTNFYVIIGEYGDEKAEIKLVSSFSGTTFTIAALTYSHEASDPITKIDYNQINFYNMATDADPAITATSTATVDIDCTQLYTEYTYSAPSYSYFCSAYYNSTDAVVSAFSERVVSTTFTRKSVKRIIESALRKAMTKMDDSPNSDLNWDNSLNIVQDGIDEILARERKWPFLRKYDGTTNDTVANTAYIPKPTDLSLLQYLSVNNVKLELYSQRDYLIRVDSGEVNTTGAPTHYTELNNLYYLYPTPSGAWDVEYYYYKIPAVITDLSTEIDSAFIPILIYYCASQFSYIRGNDKRGDKMYQMFDKLLEQSCVEFGGPESDDAEYVEFTSFISNETDLDL